MGRAFFTESSLRNREPVVRKEEERVVDYPTWSAANRFDPDSEEFFADAEFEAFIDAPVTQQEDAGFVMVDASVRMGSPVESNEGASSSDESEDNDAVMSSGSAEGSDDTLGPSIMAVDDHPATVATTAPVSPLSRRPPNVPPLDMPTEPSTPGLVSPVPESELPTPPHTPTRRQAYSADHIEPSPPPSVTPRLYSWRNVPIRMGMPLSPTRSPLTNPGARRSLARITPVRVSARV